MTLAAPDYAIIASSVAVATVGAFGGFSGSLAFLLASVAGGFAGKTGWTLIADYIPATWGRAVAVLALGLVVFGIVRLVVRKLVAGLLAQPADAIFGFLTGALTGFALAGLAVTLLGPDHLALFSAKSELMAYLPWP
jgi:hypothetical protein